MQLLSVGDKDVVQDLVVSLGMSLMIHRRKAAGEALCQCLLHIPEGHLG